MVHQVLRQGLSRTATSRLGPLSSLNSAITHKAQLPEWWNTLPDLAMTSLDIQSWSQSLSSLGLSCKQ